MFLLMGAFVSNSGMSRELFTRRQQLRRPSARRARHRHHRRLRRLCRDLRLVGRDRRHLLHRRLSGNAPLRLSAEFRHRRDRRRRHARRHAAAVHRARGLRHHHRAGHRQAVHRRHHSRPAGGVRCTSITIAIIGCVRPGFLPAGAARSLAASASPACSDIWAPLLLFVFVIGGLYGLPFLPRFTPTEAGGVGASGAFLIGVLARPARHATRSWRRCCRRRAPRPRCSPC